AGGKPPSAHAACERAQREVATASRTTVTFGQHLKRNAPQSPPGQIAICICTWVISLVGTTTSIYHSRSICSRTSDHPVALTTCFAFESSGRKDFDHDAFCNARHAVA